MQRDSHLCDGVFVAVLDIHQNFKRDFFSPASNFANKSLLGTDVFAWVVKVPFAIFVYAIVAPAATGPPIK